MAKNTDPKIVELTANIIARKKEVTSSLSRLFSVIEQLKRTPTIDELGKIRDDLEKAIQSTKFTLITNDVYDLIFMADRESKKQTEQELKKIVANLMETLQHAFPNTYKFDLRDISMGAALSVIETKNVSEGKIFKKTVPKDIEVLGITATTHMPFIIGKRGQIGQQYEILLDFVVNYLKSKKLAYHIMIM